MSALGSPRVHLRLTDSTNERARELAAAGAPSGTLVTAAEQSAGRGRGGRRWSAPAGTSILASLVLRSPPELLPLIAAVAVCEAVESATGARPVVKWPNDVLLERDEQLGKLAGILAEGRPQDGWAVLGVGVNVAVTVEDLPPELHDGSGASKLPAATLGLSPAKLEPVLEALLSALERGLDESSERTLERWRARDALRGRQVAWNDGQGRAEGIDGLGRLVVELADGGRQTLSAGEVHLRSIG
ncbi:MAG TPA: biotin--[acetyl-CoA-carboxylase] ligase [Solirubrobacteraceae bacterium]|nr:biotin--[acetyl-CoA-carboxylase] ligase [Solirubrobacteraceae bacterium]